MQDKDIKTSTYSQLFQPIFQQRIFEQLTELGVDKYVKKLSAIQLIQLIAHAQIQQQDNLREITSNFYNEDFCRAIGLESISASQISRRLRTLPPDAVKLLFKQSLTELGSQIGFDKLTKELGRLHLIDSSTISLCLTRYPWAIFRQTKSGIKLHLRLQFQDGIALPGQAVITNAKVADKREMDELVVTDKDAINVFDRGYIDYRKFDPYCQKGIRFVTRLKWNALIDVVKDFPVNGSILKDQQVYLGGNQTKMEHPLRLIEVLDTQGERIVIITNDFELEATAVGDLYRYRWQIELFFKWLKQHFSIKHFYGLSMPAVENQLYIALCSYCLLLLFKLKTGYTHTLLELTRILKVNIHKPFETLLEKLRRNPQRHSRGRHRTDYDLIYRMIEWQFFETRETDHLDDLTYDPMFL